MFGSSHTHTHTRLRKVYNESDLPVGDNYKPRPLPPLVSSAICKDRQTATLRHLDRTRLSGTFLNADICDRRDGGMNTMISPSITM